MRAVVSAAISISMLAAVIALCQGAPAGGDVLAAMAERGAMFTFLLDTGRPSGGPYDSGALAAKEGWTIVAEEAASAHVFQGDCVARNDQLALVLRPAGGGAEVYAGESGGRVYRARLVPLGPGREPAARMVGLEVLENSPAAVALRAHFETATGAELCLEYRITTGQIQVEMRPGAGVDAIRVAADTEHLVVPDVFADDLVYSGKAQGPAPEDAWIGLPAENFYLHLAGEGAAILTCVWEGAGRNARALFEERGGKQSIEGSEIDCAAGKPVWLALFEHAGAWFHEELPDRARREDVALDWTPPFDATWRANVSGTGELAHSLDIANTPPDAASHPGVAASRPPCWMEGGRAVVRVPPDTAAPTSILVYPLERTRATPLNRYLLVDVMRNTLGMGPCQYVLDLEGLDAGTSPTPALVCAWVEGRLARGRAEREADRILERLSAMAEHVNETEARIARYAAFQQRVVAILGERQFEDPAVASLLAEMAGTIRGLEPARAASGDIHAIAGRIAGLLGEPAWEKEFAEVSTTLHALGAAQDRTLAACRMALRRLKQHAMRLAQSESDGAGAARAIEVEIDRVLYREP